MADIVLSGAIRENLLSIQNTAKLLGTTQGRLATGLSVNSALDDPQAFFTAQSLTNRASDLNTLLDNTGLAVQTLNAADEGITALTSLVNQAKSTANQALNTVITASTGTSTAVGTPDTVLATATTAGVTTASIITLQAGSASFSVDISDRTAEGLVSAINADADFTATIDASGVITIGAVSGADLVIGGTVGTALGLAGTFTNGTNRDTFVTDFNNLRTQIDQLASDAGFNGVNLLNGNNLTVNFNEAQTSSLTITGVTFDAAGLNVSAVTNSGFSTTNGVNAAISQLDAAVSTLRNQASTFGNNLAVVENRESFTEALINTLETGAAGLTLADTNEEGANLLALQTRQQLGSVALSLASQADQNVLRLF